MNDFISNTKNTRKTMSEKNIVYLEVCYGKTNSICIHATKKTQKSQSILINIWIRIINSLFEKTTEQIIERWPNDESENLL